MKISQTLRNRYEDNKDHYELIKERVNDYFKNKKEDKWHYESRIKGLESYAQKIETGQYKNLDDIDDYFACTVVVENLDSLAKAEDLITNDFTLVKRKPNNIKCTSNPPDSFLFDDTRLYVKWRDSEFGKPTNLDKYIFEIQVKTFLADAWSIATHDLTYKTDEKSWSKERIAYQIKAMLEHAEVSIQEVKQLSKSSSLNKSDKTTKTISSTIEFVKNTWDEEFLPRDVKRLAENINKLIQVIGINFKELKTIIRDEITNNKGVLPLHLSPYSFVVQTLLKHKTDIVERYIKGNERKFKIYITKDINAPFDLDEDSCRNAILEVQR